MTGPIVLVPPGHPGGTKKRRAERFAEIAWTAHNFPRGGASNRAARQAAKRRRKR